VADEPLTRPDFYGEDRVFVYLRDADQADQGLDGQVDDLREAGHPVVTLEHGGPDDLGRIFFLSEFATAVAGWVLDINAFDQPNVQEAKDNTNKVLEADEPPRVDQADDAALSSLLGTAAPPHYVAIMGYVPPTDEFDDAVLDLRRTIRDATRATTTFGYGPRFLHSTGQFHKGGPPEGLFLQLTHDPGDDVPIPEADFGFRELIAAQATGDVLTLRDHGLPAERVVLEGDPAQALRALTEKVREMLDD
jgi:hypothetical protein